MPPPTISTATTNAVIQIYADESCLGNQFRDRARPGGAGGLLEYAEAAETVRRDFWISEPDTTNNRMALLSAITALGALKRPSEVVFTSDSRYLVDGISSWVYGWIRRGWKRKGGEIENLAMWQKLVEAARRHRVQWCWVKGHAGHLQNEYVNMLATRAAAEQSASGGLIESQFPLWVVDQQEAGRFAGRSPALPSAGPFKPSPPLPAD